MFKVKQEEKSDSMNQSPSILKALLTSMISDVNIPVSQINQT